ncbi:MAG: BatD family protein [Candidatus Chromulinivorax sp.]|nr:BatD family protein [Candidatus Chromulinivorax sp.]
MQKFIITVFLLASNFSFASSEIILSVQDMNHKPIKQAMCQAPFILQVELRNLDGYTDIHLVQYLTGIENFKSSRSMTSRNISIDNGKKTVKALYNFVLRSDKKGNFTLGPLVLNDASGNSIRSNRLIIPVGDEIILPDKNQQDTYFMTMSLNKKKAYVGEKLTLSVKFYDRLFVDDLHLQFPEFENLCIVKNKNNIHKNMVVFEGEEYSVTEWTFDMYGLKPESFIIQGIYAAFFAPDLESKFKFGGSFDFFRSLHKSQQQVAAQPIKIDIMPLPDHKDFHDVIAVGQFSKFTISVNQNTAPAGQGIAVTTDLFGSGNFDMMQSPSLVLPEGFKYYDSRMVSIDEKRSYKRCEFIVQATNAGTYHIEPQSFVYFDPADEQYKIIKSNALDITITPATQLSQSNILSDAALHELTEEGQVIPKSLHDFYIIEQGAVHVGSPLMIPSQKFHLLIWLLLLIWFVFIFYHNIISKYVLQDHRVKKIIIFSQAKKACNIARNRQQVNKLHTLFIRVFQQLMGVDFGELHDAAIIQYLIRRNFSDEQIRSWKKFYEQILQASFSSKVVMQQQLFDQALEWIQLLKDKA